ncbi:MAG: ornithine cyclodeaminase [Verrucomicrobiales bacterium]|jgi:ornithine cyclodeaminase
MAHTDQLLVLSATDVEACLPMAECIDAMGDAFRMISSGEVHNPLRNAIVPPLDGAPGILGLMPAVRGGDGFSYGLKEVCVFPGNHALGIDSHQGSVLVHEGETGRLVAILNGSAVTAIRTAAATAVASRVLARPQSNVLALVGAGFQARWHLEALAQVHQLDEVRVCSRNPASSQAFAERWSSTYAVRAVGTVEEAMRGADIVTTVTNSPEPVVDRRWVETGMHLNAVGSSVASKREMDSATVAASRLFVDSRVSAVNEAGDLLLASADGVVADEHIIAEVGEVLNGSNAGRRDDDEITLFKSLGLAIEDLLAAEVAIGNAQELGRGTVVDF